MADINHDGKDDITKPVVFASMDIREKKKAQALLEETEQANANIINVNEDEDEEE